MDLLSTVQASRLKVATCNFPWIMAQLRLPIGSNCSMFGWGTTSIENIPVEGHRIPQLVIQFYCVYQVVERIYVNLRQT